VKRPGPAPQKRITSQQYAIANDAQSPCTLPNEKPRRAGWPWPTNRAGRFGRSWLRRAKQGDTEKGKLLFAYGFGRAINYGCTTASGASAAERRKEQACRASKKGKARQSGACARFYRFHLWRGQHQTKRPIFEWQAWLDGLNSC